jgi:uncharacterized coiled-coil DUF342 family protein
MDGSPRTSMTPPPPSPSYADVDAETKRLRDHQQTREELLGRVHGLKNELAEWRFKMDGRVKDYRGELSALKETLASEVGALRKDLEETSARLKKQILVGDRDGASSSPARLVR